MAEPVLLDTNILIYASKGHPFFEPYRQDLVDRVAAVSFVTAAEVLLTARKTQSPQRVLAYWRQRLPLYVLLLPDLETCDIWAQITSQCHARGTPRQDNDLWTAAVALRHRLPLVMHNARHFAGIEGLRIVTHS
jgi:predicted nucleic acid-binding protein